jgi:transcription antitermination protein NusB
VSLPQQKNRELVFEVLYSLHFHGEGQSDQEGGDSKSMNQNELCLLLMQEHKVTKKNATFAIAQANAILKEMQHLDALIQKVSHSYDLKRIHFVERAILRLALYELFIEKKNPPEIVIAEAKRLARKFTNEEAQGFVHALIDALIKQETEAGKLQK